MRYLLLLIVNTAWALWFGATLALFVFVPYLFQAHHDIAGEAASAMFVVFAKYELVLAGVAVLATGLLLVTYPTNSMLGVLAALIICGGMAITFSLGLIPRMESLRQQGQQHGDEFKKYHAKSMTVLVMQSGMLLLGGAAILAAAKPYKKPVEIEDEPKSDSEYEPMFDDKRPRGL